MRENVLIIILVVIGLCVAPVPSIGMKPDEEPNDTFETAMQVQEGSYDGLQLSEDDTDFYALTVEPGESVRVTVKVDKNGGEVPEGVPSVDIYNQQQEDVAGGFVNQDDYSATPASDTATYNITHQSDYKQTIYIELDGVGRTEEPVSYALDIQTQDDAFEPNGVFETASRIEAGMHSDLKIVGGDDTDTYAYDVEAGESIRVTTVLEKRNGELADDPPDIDIYNEKQERVFGSYSGGTYDTTPVRETATTNVTYHSETAQTLYIELDGGGTSATVFDYSLAIESRDDAFEPNGIFESAAAIQPGSYEDLRLLGGDDVDIYALDVTPGQTVTLNLTVTKHDGKVPESAPDIDLYNQQQERVFGMYSGSEYDTTPVKETATMNVTYEVESARTLYVELDGSGRSAVPVNYALDASTTGTDESGSATTETRTGTPTPTPTPTQPATTTQLPATETDDGTAEMNDRDGDGVPDSEDYAPGDPDVQDESDVRDADDTSGAPGFGVVSAVVALAMLLALRRQR